MYSLASTLLSGKGLMTAIGLGVGAYEILKSREGTNPPPLSALPVAPPSDPRVAQTIYSLAVSTVVVDTAEERAWLDKLAAALSVSEGMRRFIEAED